jgi:hypothetical protein
LQLLGESSIYTRPFKFSSDCVLAQMSPPMCGRKHRDAHRWSHVSSFLEAFTFWLTNKMAKSIAGLAIGVLSMITPLYQVEISHPKWRGFMAGTFQQML